MLGAARVHNSAVPFVFCAAIAGTPKFRHPLRSRVLSKKNSPRFPSSFFLQEKQEKQDLFANFANLTEGKISGTLGIPIFGGIVFFSRQMWNKRIARKKYLENMDI